MKEYTQHDALVEIFSERRISAKLNVYKHRYAKGQLTQKSIDEILLNNGFVVTQEKIYTKG